MPDGIITRSDLQTLAGRNAPGVADVTPQVLQNPWPAKRNVLASEGLTQSYEQYL
jgi:hypothetical protein